MDKDRFIRVKSKEKLISYRQENVLDNLGDLSTDFVFNPNLNNSDFISFDNSQLSTFFRCLSDSPTTLLKEEKSITATNFKTVKGLGFYFCDSCPFLCLNMKSFLQHIENNRTEHSTIKSMFKVKCIGCDNIFYSLNVLRCHLAEDHDVLPVEIDELIQLVVEANKEDTLYMNDEMVPTDENNLTDLNTNFYETILGSSEFTQRSQSQYIDTQLQITGENNLNFIDDCHSNETSNNSWQNIDQVVSNGLQENYNNNNNNDQNNLEKYLRCPIGMCKIKFGKEENLEYHKKMHSDKEFQCIESECQYTNTKWSSMITHLWKTHSKDLEMYSCDKCSFKTNSLYKLNNFHKNIHSSEKAFLCTVCNKGFKSIKQLRNHKTIHTNNKEKKRSRNDTTCFHCSREFSTKNLLHQHIVSIHIGARPYACTVCEYTTAVASSLKMHMRQHTGEKPFKCTECDYSSADHNSLRKHKMRHTGQKSYACPLCSYSSIQASSFQKHLKAKHPGMDDGFMYSCNMCNFKTIRKDMYMLHNVKHKEETLQKNGICEPLVDLDEIFNEKEKIQVEIAEQSSLFHTIRVKPINTMKPNESAEKNNEVFTIL